MPDPASWFRHMGFWHVAETPTKAMCGVERVKPPKLVPPRSSDDLPPDPCRTCLHKLWFDEVEEETLQDCYDRGFEVSGPIDLPDDAD